MASLVCIGMPVFNGSEYLRQALNSLLTQTISDFHIVILDDGSTDDSYSILETYSGQDSRISLFRNPTRTGLIAAWNRVAELSDELFSPTYFAWYSDHDWVAKNWLEDLRRVLESNPDTVLAHPQTITIDVHGKRGDTEALCLDTSSSTTLDAFRTVTLEFFGAGDAIYGLFRYEALRRISFLPHEIFPDRLVVSEACLHGTIRHVPSARRYRRNLSPKDYPDVIVARQLQTLFASETEQPKAPLLRHGTYFLRLFLERPDWDRDDVGRTQRLIHAYLYLVRQFNRFGMVWEKEYGEANQCEDLASSEDLLSFIVDGKWIPLTREAESRLREFKVLCNDFREGLADANERLAAQTARLEDAKARLFDAESQCAILCRDLTETRASATAHSFRCNGMEERLREAELQCAELRQAFAETKERLAASIIRCEGSEARLQASESRCVDLQRHFAETHDRFITQNERRKQAEAEAVELHMQVALLAERIKHPLRELLQRIVGPLRKSLK